MAFPCLQERKVLPLIKAGGARVSGGETETIPDLWRYEPKGTDEAVKDETVSALLSATPTIGGLDRCH